MDYAGSADGERCKESLLHLQEAGQEIGGAEDGASPGSQHGANAALLVNLFSSLLISGSVNKRSTGKAWGVIFVCTSTHVEIAETYSTESFLMAKRDWSAVHKTVEKAGAELHVVQYYNSQAERLICLLKRCLESTMANPRFTLGELSTVMAEAAQMVNSRPIARNSGDPESGRPIMPLHLRLGRASVEIPRMKFDEAKKQFWDKWMRQVISGRMLSHKWAEADRSVAVGDVVYLGEAENDNPTYRLDMVEEVRPGENGCVRTVNIRYTNPGKEPGKQSPPKVTTRPIHKIPMIVPADYVFEDDMGGDKAGQRRPRHQPSTREGADAVGVQGEDPARGTSPEEPEEAGSPLAGLKGPGRPKKSAEPKSADRETGKDPQPAAKRRPGRPRKKPGVGPDGGKAKKEGEEQAAHDRGEQPQTPRRRPYAPGTRLPRSRRPEGRVAGSTSPDWGSVRIS